MKKLNSYSLWIVFITLYYTTAPQIPFGSQTWQFKISHKWTFLWNKIYMGYFPLPRLITRGYFRGCVVLSISEQRMKTSGNRGLGSDLFRHLWLWVKTPMPLVFPNNRDLCMFISPHLHMGLSKNPDINQMVFPRVIVFFSSYRFSKCWLHTLMKQFILCFLCGISPYNHQLHICFSGKSLPAKLAASNMSHKQYIMYMYEHRYRFFSSYRFLEWELHIANGGSWHTKRIGAGLLYSPT